MRSLLDALRTNPGVLDSDLGGGSTVKRGILIVGDRHYQADDLASLQRLYSAASTAAPDDVDLANNEGLFARDYGSEIEESDPVTAAEMFEASYQAYTHASRLDPDNIRLRNDRALLLIYHLDRELDAAVELLRGAIADGNRRLAKDPPTDPSELRDLQESVGDAYGNLGYYYMNKVRDYEKTRENIDKSLEFYPFEERAGTRQLAELEREKGGPR